MASQIKAYLVMGEPAWANQIKTGRLRTAREIRLELSEIAGDEIPVHEIPEFLEVLRTRVAVVDIVGVFPYVTGHQGHVISGDGRFRVIGVDDIKAAVGFLYQPGPTRTKVAGCRLVEFFLEGVEAAPLCIDGVKNLAGGLAAAIG